MGAAASGLGPYDPYLAALSESLAELQQPPPASKLLRYPTIGRLRSTIDKKAYKTMLYSWHDVVGNVGVTVILATYLLLQLEKLPVTSAYYSIVNGLGAVLILISLVSDFNLSAFVIEVAWFLISVYGVVRSVARRRSATAVE